MDYIEIGALLKFWQGFSDSVPPPQSPRAFITKCLETEASDFQTLNLRAQLVHDRMVGVVCNGLRTVPATMLVVQRAEHNKTSP